VKTRFAPGEEPTVEASLDGDELSEDRDCDLLRGFGAQREAYRAPQT
jgi:hypothetical protein